MTLNSGVVNSGIQELTECGREVTGEGRQGPHLVGACHAGRTLDFLVGCKEGSVVLRLEQACLEY